PPRPAAPPCGGSSGRAHVPTARGYGWVMGSARGALCGAAAAAVWALQQPLDKRVFGVAFDDVELLGKAVTRGPRWRAAGTAWHVANGAAFGAVYAPLAARA